MVIAIDGPAGAGKSTVAKILASRLGIRYLDTGAMYRALALKALRAGLTSQDGVQAAQILENTEIEFGPGNPQRVLLDGEDVTDLIRTMEISELASALSVFSEVRAGMVSRQKALVAEGSCVLEGRDTTTVVAPTADVKVFLTASLEERARRRHQELAVKGSEPEIESLTKQISERDHRDYTREDSPLTCSSDAHLVETFGLTPDQVADQIMGKFAEG
ncbi:MAG: (d)CMP kinase [Armatimonadetes bacterium]|nr:(d)CMP kinase [Armatimonadota bacterium]